MSIKTISLLFIFLLLLSPSAFSGTIYEGPNGEIYVGDYLPQELRDKGYKDKNSQKETQLPKAKTSDRVPISEAPMRAAAKPRQEDRDSKKSIILSLPDDNPAIQFPFGGFTIKQGSIAPDGRSARLMAENSKSGLLISAFIEKAPSKGDGKSARKFYWEDVKNRPFQLSNVTMSERGDIATVAYTVKEYNGMAINQKNIFAYFAKDFTWGYIHISKVDFNAADQKFFDDILSGLRVHDSYAKTAEDYLNHGTAFHKAKNFQKAIPNYKKAIDLLQNDKKLKPEWYIAVDNLAVAYGKCCANDEKKMFETYQYGLSKDPSYPMFNFSLAIVYADKGDLDKTVEHLRKAMKFKANMLPGEQMPNPFRVPVFQKYQNNEKFLAAMKE